MAHDIEYSTTGKPHPYHLVRPSIWPLAGAFAGGLLAVGMVLFMHGVELAGFKVGLKGVFIGVLAVLSVMFFWWRDIIFETVTEKVHNAITSVGLRYGMALFIASEVMFFVAFFWAFFNASLFPVQEIGNVWPPAGMEVIPPFDLPLMMTLILLLSGCAVTWAHHAILENNQRDFIRGVAASTLLGFFFLAFQVYEYVHAPFGFGDNVYTSAFFMATGFHGFHVFVGATFLAVCWLRARKGHFTKDSHFGFEAAAWYWHFVDVVWLFLFIAVYVWGNLHSGTAIFAAH
jgi:cytochrome c oxidase subunit 3